MREVELRYTAKRAGPVEEVYACRVFGMELPLGFLVKGRNKVRYKAIFMRRHTGRSAWLLGSMALEKGLAGTAAHYPVSRGGGMTITWCLI